MILIDPRIGSAEVEPYFLPYGVATVIAGPEDSWRDFTFADDTAPDHLPFGDFCFWGNGPDAKILIGVERKVIRDMIASMRDKRFQGHQLPGLMQTFEVVHLVIEGIWRCGNSGAIEMPRNSGWETLYMGTRPILFEELDHFLATLQYKRGLIVAYTANREQTAAYIASRYNWWNKKEWHQHKSDEGIYTHYQPVAGSGKRAGFVKRTVPKVEKMIAQLDGFDSAAYSIAKVYSNMAYLMNATVTELSVVQIEQHGKKGSRFVNLGKAKADRLWLQLRGM